LLNLPLVPLLILTSSSIRLTSGRKATRKILSQVKGVDLADFYKDYKDVMGWWQEEGFRNFAKIKNVVEEKSLYRKQERPRGFGLGL